RHTRSKRDWSSDVCSSDLADAGRRSPADVLPSRIFSLLPFLSYGDERDFPVARWAFGDRSYFFSALVAVRVVSPVEFLAQLFWLISEPWTKPCRIWRYSLSLSAHACTASR